jgi:hypothetical protein
MQIQKKDNSMSIVTTLVSSSINVQDIEITGLPWKQIYRIGGAASMIAVSAGLFDVFLMFLPGTAYTPGSLSIVDWFLLLHTKPFLALRNLGLLKDRKSVV